MSLLSSDCYFESLALQETFKGPQVCQSLTPPYTSPHNMLSTRSISPLQCTAMFQGNMEVKALHETHGAAQHSEQATDMVPQAISRLLDMLLQNLSADVHHVVECITDGHSPSALAVLWRVRGRQSNLLHAKVHPLL